MQRNCRTSRCRRKRPKRVKSEVCNTLSQVDSSTVPLVLGPLIISLLSVANFVFFQAEWVPVSPPTQPSATSEAKPKPSAAVAAITATCTDNAGVRSFSFGFKECLTKRVLFFRMLIFLVWSHKSCRPCAKCKRPLSNRRPTTATATVMDM